MNNYKLIIQYDGTNYAGWQIQKNAPSIQQKITDALSLLVRGPVNLIGAGRTDSGVHALGQTANFLTEKAFVPQKLQYQLNCMLQSDISVTNAVSVPETFHSRFDAKERSYIYLFSKFKSPFYKNFSYKYKGIIDTHRLNDLSRFLIGTKDFTSFSRKNSDTKNKICAIKEIRWKETQGFVVMYIAADRFLHGMVRTITGTLLKAAETGKGKEYFDEIISLHDRSAAGEAVPAQGLFLYKVKY